MSKHVVDIFPVKLEAHPNADSLSLVRVPGTEFVVCARSADWRDDSLAAYIEPDMVVPDQPAYAFLCAHLGDHQHACKKCRRIRAKKLRGVWSMGLLMPAPDGLNPGDNALEAMEITRYEPPPPPESAGRAFGACLPHQPPPGIDHKYDVENGRRYKVFEPGEAVVVTEKIHGCNARYTFRDGHMWAGSRTRWLKQDDTNMWWKIAAKYPSIEALCRALPDHTLYGEIYGDVQDLKYGAAPGEYFFAAFDILDPYGRWVDVKTFDITVQQLQVPAVPILATGPYSPETIAEFIDGTSTIGKNIREGIVVKPLAERWTPELGRVIVKYVSNAYLERAK